MIRIVSHKKKATIVFITIVALLIIIFKAKEGENYLVANATYGQFEVSVTVTGELEAQNNTAINAPQELNDSRMGYIRTKIQDLVPEGTLVDSGGYVASLDVSELINQLSEIEIEVNKQNSELQKTILDTTLAMRDLRNQLKDLKYGLEEKQLIVEQSIYEPPATLRQAEITYEKAQREYAEAQINFSIKVAQHKSSVNEKLINLNQIEKRKQSIENLVDKFTIYAQRPGMVIYNRDRMGNIMGVGTEIAQWNMTIATLPDMSKMISKAFVNEIDINKIKVGQKVIVQLDAVKDKQIEGKVSRVANIGMQIPFTDAKVFEIIIEIDNPDPVMKPSMTTSNTIICEQYDNIIFVPLEAVHSNDSLNYVFTHKHRQVVELGASNNNFVIISKGLEKQQEVLLNIPENIEKFPLKGIAK